MPKKTSEIKSGQDDREWDKYFDLYAHYRDQYAQQGYPNKKFALLYEIGSFWELYGIDNGKEKLGNIREILDITGHRTTQKNNNNGYNPKNDPMINDRDHPLFGGYPFGHQEDAEAKLINAGFDLIYHVQTGEVDPDTDKKIRKFDRIVTPGSFIGELVDSNSCHTISIFIKNITSPSQPLFKWQDVELSIGMTSVDLTTNEATVYSVKSKELDQMYALNEVYRFLKSMNPKEIMISVENCDLQVELNDLTFEKFLKQELELSAYKTAAHDVKFIDLKFLREDYQLEIIKTVYPHTKKTSNGFDHLRITNESEIRVSITQLFDYVYRTNPAMLKHLEPPKIWSAVNHFTLTNNAITQLEIDFPTEKQRSEKKSLLQILDKTTTRMGKRLFRNTLLNPILSARKLDHRWNLVDLLKEDNRWKRVEDHLTGIFDLTKLYKRLCVQRLYPCELLNVQSSHNIVKKLLDFLIKTEWGEEMLFLLDEDDIDTFQEFIDYIDETFDLPILGEYHFHDINRSLFKKGVYSEIDRLQSKIDRATMSLDDFYDTICGLCKLDPKVKNPSVKVSNRNRRNKKSPVSFSMTAKRYEIIEHYISKIEKGHINIHRWPTLKSFDNWQKKRGDESEDEEDEEENLNNCLTAKEISCLKSIYKVDKSKSVYKFQSKNVSGDSDERLKHEDKIKKLVEKQYIQCLSDMESKFSRIMDIITAQVALVDLIKSNAKTAVKYGYCRPQIDPDYDENSEDAELVSSYICAKSLRHPIIEQINKRHKFIPNDVEIGGSNTKGLILHAVNDAGKSSLLKAIGLSILQAQMGGFVPAKEYTFIPFHNILTRLSGMDNMYKNQGSFAVEASELRDISERCNHKSLVLADELCRGTEHASAIGIVTGGVTFLDRAKANFVLATHLHDLYKLPEIQSLQDRIQIKHLQVERDPRTNLLTYIRKLQDGPGNAYYGIEVARAQGVNEEILHTAEAIRKRYIDMSENLVMDNRSHFNRKKYIPYWCEVCNERKAEHIHHMAEQNTADENGMIDNEFHKNDLFNLVGLCHQCHDDIHIRQTLIVNGYQQTSEGTKLDWSRKSGKRERAERAERVERKKKKKLDEVY